jgi:hypothetical protein
MVSDLASEELRGKVRLRMFYNFESIIRHIHAIHIKEEILKWRY